MAEIPDQHELIEEGPRILSRERFSPENRKRLSGPGLRTFLNIARAWNLSVVEKRHVLGLPARSTLHQWITAVEAQRPIRLPVDVLLRISAVLGVYKDLQIIFGDEQEGVQWLQSANGAPCFGNQRPIDLIVSGTQDGIMLVRRYLDAWRGGVFAAPTNAPFEEQPWSSDDLRIIRSGH